MARKKTDEANGQTTGTSGGETATMSPPTEPAAERPQEQNGAPDKKKPAFKVGPIATGKGESVSACVWENEHAMSDGRVYTVHSIQLELSYFHEGERAWKPSRSIRPSQLAAVEYVLRQSADYCFRARDPQQDIAF